jgi:hypothetical protein
MATPGQAGRSRKEEDTDGRVEDTGAVERGSSSSMVFHVPSNNSNVKGCSYQELSIFRCTGM